MRRLLIAVVVVTSACSVEQAATTSSTVDLGYTAVASEVCPMLWKWQLSVGQVMNDMSSATRDEPSAVARSTLISTAFTRARDLNRELRGSLSDLTPGPYVDLLSEDILNGLAFANSIIDDLEDEVGLRASGTSNLEYQEIVPVIFIAFEKVIDVAKPEMATYHNDDLIAAFMTVPQCQNGVKDANDGVPRYVPLDA